MADRVYEAVTPRTKAVLAVHLFGRPLDWEALQSAVPPDVPLLEDAAGALGARWQGMPCGGLGLLGCLSFHPRKIVTTGEGGAVTTSDDGIADAIRRHAPPRDRAERRLRDRLAGDELPAFGCALRARPAAGAPARRAAPPPGDARRRLHRAARGRCRDAERGEGDRHGWQAYVVQVDRRDEILAALREQGIEAQIGTYALHRLRAYHEQGPFPGADRAFERALALPFHTRLTEGELDRVAEGLTSLVSD